MHRGGKGTGWRRKANQEAFTLVDLLIVIGIIALLATLLTVGVSAAKARARRITCLNNLSQIGKAMTMYVGENNKYPSAIGGPPFQTWEGSLTPYTGISWTNAGFNCPSFLAEGGVVAFSPPPPEGGRFTNQSSYAYNANGMSGFASAGTASFSKGLPQGLAVYNRAVLATQIVAPSEMYEAGDTRPFLLRRAGVDSWIGPPVMQAWKLITIEAPPLHGDGYNLLFVDGHVSLVKRKDYLYPPRAAQHWNRDNQPHPELWSAPGEWAVTN